MADGSCYIEWVAHLPGQLTSGVKDTLRSQEMIVAVNCWCLLIVGKLVDVACIPLVLLKAVICAAPSELCDCTCVYVNVHKETVSTYSHVQLYI